MTACTLRLVASLLAQGKPGISAGAIHRVQDSTQTQRRKLPALGMIQYTSFR